MSGGGVTADLEAIADGLLRRAKALGADHADVLAAAGESLSVTARGGAMEEAERAESVDFGLRVLIDAVEDGTAGRRQAVVSASDAAPGALDALAERAVAMAREAPLDPYARLAEPAELMAGAGPDLDLVDPDASPSPEALLEMGLALEAAALEIAGVAQVEGAGAGWSRSRSHFATSNGFAQGYASGSVSISGSAVAGEGLGMERDYAFSAARRLSDLREVADVGAEAGRRAVRRLNPRRPKTGVHPVLFEPRVAVRLLGSILGALSGSAVARGSSYLKDKMGARILPAGFDVFDDPLRPRGLGSRPFDGEGVASRAKTMISDGVVSAWFLDLSAAAQLGLEGNGSASRGVGGTPSPGGSNAWTPAGARSPEEMMRAMGEGLLVTETMGGGVNGVTGDYSTGAAGYWIEGGEIAHPVSELTIAGRIFEMAADLERADDLTFERRLNAPSLLVGALTVAAESA